MMKDIIERYKDKLSETEHYLLEFKSNGSSNDIAKKARLEEARYQYKSFIEVLNNIKIEDTQSVEIDTKNKSNIIMSHETYGVMKSFVEFYERKNPNKIIHEPLTHGDALEESPYLTLVTVDQELKYNTKFGDHRMCECGHPYHRHFDSYEKMEACGCKYCRCYIFNEKKDG